MKSKNGKKISIVTAVSLMGLATLVSCGEGSETKKSFTANLEIINPTLSPGITGNIELYREKDNFTVSSNLINAPVGVHIQRITIGSRCPILTDDTNVDGYIDALEAEVATGKAIIPLDSDLSSQDAGAGEYPSDSYTYSQTASFSQMLSDLLIFDANPNDSVTKITSAEQLNFEGKVFVVHGAASDSVLPTTVQTIDGLPAVLTVPIACGVLKGTEEEGGGTTTGGTTTGGTTTGGTTTGGTTTGGLPNN